ncbi:MAG: DUF115 domain-containing protein [Ruminococcus sp.]|nr:6-hydroxymethylpterin diphosphokinase MptE-like protein [Ruminococcus sp.]MDD5889719.1 DUF115 domain-containing protein [Ruminococcus sp.]
MNPIKSLIAHNQGRIYNNFENSKYGKRLKQFKNIHKGETCFIIGNGPSLKVEDLTKLHELGVPTFAFNRVFCVFDETPWRPTYYISQDENVTYGMTEKFMNLDLPYRFHPIRWKWDESINIPNAYWYKTIGNGNVKIYGFSDDFSKLVYDSPTVAYAGIQMAYYMGFKKIYLIGVDQNYKVSLDKDGNVVTNNSIKNDYFSDKYKDEKNDDLQLPNLYKMNKAFISAKYHIENDKLDLKIYNATRGGMLEVFERVDLDEIFKELEETKK